MFIQTTTTNVHSVLQAKALGLLLAATVVKALKWNKVSFLCDCRNLVSAAKAKDLIQKPGHWKIRPTLADFFSTLFQIYFNAQLNNVISDWPWRISISLRGKLLFFAGN